ncbi:MAG: thiolase domain-containing protein [Candidatus Heimdallarchaeota archaeon]|nr:thiolase domain-containing protein [Candidatus Heimdallarchaeota archaeon]
MKTQIIGAGVTRFGSRTETSYRELLAEAASLAFDSMDAITPSEIDGLYIAAGQPELLVGQAHVGNLATQMLGIEPRMVSRVEMACASGATAVRQANAAIQSGMADVVLVLGIEKMTHNMKAASQGLCLVPDVVFDSLQGVSAYSGFALTAQKHMEKYGTTREQLAAVAVKNHANAARNDKAQFHSMGEISLEKVLTSRMVADPLTLFDCSPISDGAAALLLTSENLSSKYTDQPISIIGSGESIEKSIGVSNLPSLTEWPALQRAASQAFSQAGIQAKDIDVAEIHDCFSIAEIIEYEELGFVAKGKGGQFIEDGESSLDGSLPVNPSGGLKGKGHPIGATGVAQLVELTEQLRGNSGSRQISDAEIGLAHNLGGFAAHHVVHILSNLPQ